MRPQVVQPPQHVRRTFPMPPDDLQFRRKCIDFMTTHGTFRRTTTRRRGNGGKGWATTLASWEYRSPRGWRTAASGTRRSLPSILTRRAVETRSPTVTDVDAMRRNTGRSVQIARAPSRSMEASGCLVRHAQAPTRPPCSLYQITHFKHFPVTSKARAEAHTRGRANFICVLYARS